jgi:hypothetical protein
MKYISIIIVFLAFNCKTTSYKNVKVLTDANTTTSLNSVSVIWHLFENMLYLPEDRRAFDSLSLLKLTNVEILYEKGNYHITKKFDSIIAETDSVYFSTLRNIESNWPDRVSLNGSEIKVRFRSTLFDSDNELIFDGCMKNNLIFSDSITTSAIDEIPCEFLLKN